MKPWIKFFRADLAFALGLVTLVAGCGSPDQNAQKYYGRGMALIEKKDDLEARKELLQAVKYKSDKVEVWKALAGIDERTKAQSLFLDLRRIVELDPKDLDARLKLARIMIGGGAAEAALKVLEAANEDKPNAELHALRAVVFLKDKDAASAVREAQRAFEIDPANVDAVSLLASKKLADGDADGALKLLDSITIEPKDEARISLQKMQAYAKKGDLAKAESLLRKVIALNPKEPAYRTQLIQLLIAQRRFDEAEKEFRGRVSADPTNTKLGLDLVRFLNLAKGPDVARTELENRIKAGGDIFEYQVALSELNIRQNKIDEATELLKTLANGAATPDRKSIAQLKLAELYMSKANVAAAEPLIAEVIKQDRRNAGALRLRAAIKIDKSDVDGAVSDLREALNDQPKSPELLMLLAVAYERGGKNELADRQYADALKSSNSNPDVALRYVGFLQRRGDASHAEDVLTDVSGRYPNNLQVLSSLAQLRLSRQNWTGALTVADTIGKLSDGRALSDQIRASALAGQNKIDESIVALEDAHQAAPDAVQPVVSLVSAYVKQGKPDKAVTLLQDMNNKFPTNSQILVMLGQAKLTQNKDQDAIQNFKDAITKQPKDPVGYAALSDLYIRQKNYDAADNVLQAGLKELPTNVNLKLSSAGIQIQKGNHDAAISQYESILKDQPNSAVAVNNLVSLLLDYRSDKESLDRAFSLADLLKNATVPQFQDTWGWAQYRKGDYKGAIGTLEAAAAKLPDLAALHYHLGMSYKAAGEPEKAAEQLKTALSLEPDGTALKESISAAMK
ncbi:MULTISPECIES: tetratricopeptide repeat protein [Bradyrhizobium]|uniref:Pentatricopeptide repeat domain-containing protein (PPR motif) n=2 Tax=Bradyrhizobium TaxID=374 RepID=A0ABY0Q7B5_9BRAD|nr:MULTISPECIES: tetratricopeptide repeat protein [Bradyrhizobium]SDJ64106.1 pentatricopeptide repeat domain-containing protein (PPR motif) [Bradyrhizobium ottawaense]SEC32491.1 pentatricopeptide repeat domain-containing protein (PPR motif) [Bradyrhizobium lablabi]